VAEIENGYTRIANELLEAITGSNLTKRQFKVILAIVRLTYGWQKKQDRISNSQLAEITNLPVKRVSETRVQLIEMNIVSSKGKLIGINKNINEWKIPQNEGKSLETGVDTQNGGKSLKLGDNKSLKAGDSYPSKQGNTKDIIPNIMKYNNTPLTPHEGNDEKLISNNRKTKIPYQEILQVYNETVGDRLPNAESLNDKRKRAIGKFWKELKNPSVDAARNYFEVFVETANPWYFGENDRGWRASFDYLLRPDTVTKTREGAL
ncbi:replication protein, partial [Arsenophonus sp.]|uniref:replication protein n=1 Tax=Arsenophonus sp. TaxID=1872640 RepID=UPI003879BD8F